MVATGIGTAIAFTTLVFPAGLLVGANPVLLFDAILSGAVFGDNLAPVSDTTIVSAVTQDADIGGVVASRCPCLRRGPDTAASTSPTGGSRR